MDLALCFVGGFCRPCLSGSFHPFSRGYTGSASSPPGFCSAITPDIPVCGFTGLRELVLDRHCGQEQLSGAEWRHFPSLCFPDGEIAFNLLANLWWWNSLLVCLFRLLWHPPMQASVAPFGCQGSGRGWNKQEFWLLRAAPLHSGVMCSDIPATHAEP